MRRLDTAQADPLSADDQFFAALLGVNRDALDRLLAPDFLLIDVMTGSEIPRAPFLDLVGSGQLVFDAIDPAVAAHGTPITPPPETPAA